MRNCFLPILAVLFTLVCNGQLYNNGSSIKIQPGAYLFVGGDVVNTNSGTIINDGKLEVQGNFTNSATYNSATSDDSLLLTGGGDVTLNGGTSTLNYLTINKTVNSNKVTLTGSTLLGTKLDYLSGNFSTDPIANPLYVLSAPVAAVFNFSAGREITGNVKRTSWVNGTSVMFNQPNMLVKTNAGTAPVDFTVTMIPQSAGGDPTQAEREVKRKFQFANTGGSGFTADISFPYLTTELNTNVEGNLVPWDLVSAEWNGRLTPITRDGTSHFVSTTGITATELANEWKLADSKYSFNITVFLRGAWNNGSGLMRNTLNTGGLLPLSQPYTGAPFNYAGTESVASIPNSNIVDWVLIEYRKPSTGNPSDANASSIVGRKAGFVLMNGNVVDLDGVTPITYDITKQGPGFIVVRHRNHLAIMSNILASNAAGTFSNDFSLLSNSYKNPTSLSDAVTVLSSTAPGINLYGLWPGDVNQNGSVTTTDLTPVNVAISGLPVVNTNIYDVKDVNLDKNVTTTDLTNVNFSIFNFAKSSTSKINPFITNQPAVLVSQVPGEVK